MKYLKSFNESSEYLKMFEEFEIEGTKIKFTPDELQKLNTISVKLGYDYTSAGNGYYNGFYRLWVKSNRSRQGNILSDTNVVLSALDEGKSYFKVFKNSPLTGERIVFYQQEISSVDEFIELLKQVVLWSFFPLNLQEFMDKVHYIYTDLCFFQDEDSWTIQGDVLEQIAEELGVELPIDWSDQLVEGGYTII